VHPKKDKNLAELRAELRVRFFGAGKSGAPYNRLNELTFTMMKAIIAGDFPISVKYNAMLVIGELNETEFDAAVGAKLKPLPKALDFMIKVVQSKSSKVPDYLRVPALLGILRHAEIHPTQPMPPDLRPAVTKTLLELLAQKTPPDNRTPEAQAWLRRLAAEALGSMGEPGLEGGAEVLSALAATVKDANNPPSVRCAAAQAFGEMKLPNNVDTSGLCIDVLALLDMASKKEIALAKEEQTELNRRRLATCLASVRIAIYGPDAKRGLQVGVPEEKQELVKKIRTNLIAMIKLLDKGTVKPSELQVLVTNLEEIIKTYGKGAAIPGPGPVAAAPAAAAPPVRGKPVARAE
jgi:hypothetical protein